MFWHQKSSRQSKITTRNIYKSKINRNRRILAHWGRAFRNLKPIKKMYWIHHWNSQAWFKSRRHKVSTMKEYYQNRHSNSKGFSRNNNWTCRVKIKDSNCNNSFMDKTNNNSVMEIALSNNNNNLLTRLTAQTIEISWTQIIVIIITNIIRTTITISIIMFNISIEGA